MGRYLHSDQINGFDDPAWVEQRTAEYRISNRRISKVGIATLYLFYKIDRIHYFDIRYSGFDIRYSLFYKLRKTEGSFSIKVADSAASSWAEL